VKPATRKIQVLAATLLYCYAAMGYAHAGSNCSFRSAQPDIQTEQRDKVFLLAAGNEAEFHNVTNPANGSSPTAQESSEHFLLALQARAQQVEALLANLVALSQTRPVNHTRSDIIFPFHYFW